MTYMRLPRGDRQMYSFGQLNPYARPYAPQVVDVGAPGGRPAGMFQPQVVGLGPAETEVRDETGAEGMMAQAMAPDAAPFRPQVASLGGLGVQLSPAGPSMPQVVPLGGMGEQLDPDAQPFRPQVVSLAGQLDPGASPYQPQYVQLQGLGQPRAAVAMVTTLPAGTAVNAELFARPDGTMEWAGGELLTPLQVRRNPDGSYTAIGRASIKVTAHVNPGRQVRMVPTASR